jgi:glutaminase
MSLPFPDGSAIAEAVETAYREMTEIEGGKNADYIPVLASVPGNLAGIAVATCDGAVHEAGDSRYAFAIESISKLATLALVMEAIGPDAVRAKVGTDPTGLPFDSVIALELHHGRPMSPLVNAGAIATASLVSGNTPEARWARILDMQSRLAGRSLTLSDVVNRSEQATNFHNRAIAWLLFSAGTCYADPLETLDIYTRQCSTLITVADLAAIGATLANDGVNPATGKRVLTGANARHILAEMMMEGLYTASGDFAYCVGLPGKSGVGGGILAVAPGRLAIAGFAPPLDEAGNSVRGIAAVTSIARALRINLFQPPAA